MTVKIDQPEPHRLPGISQADVTIVNGQIILRLWAHIEGPLQAIEARLDTPVARELVVSLTNALATQGQ
jgi:hypothetical protein